MSIHRTLDGAWAECDNPSCELLFHTSELTVGEAERTPLRLLLPIFEAVDPPRAIDDRGAKLWYKPESLFGEPIFHREYDLPAVIYPTGHMEWWLNGSLSRLGSQPAVIWADGDTFTPKESGR